MASCWAAHVCPTVMANKNFHRAEPRGRSQSRRDELTEDVALICGDFSNYLRARNYGRLTIGQYQQPTLKHWPVAKYYHPDEFAGFEEIAYKKGFKYVEAGPLVRSSYHAAKAL